MILILGAPEEAHAAFMREKLQHRGQPVAYLDTRQFPRNAQWSYQPSQARSGVLRLDGQTIPLAEVHAVYWRSFMGISLPGGVTDPFQLEMAQREIESAIGSMFRCMNHCRWVNSAEAIAMHTFKPYQTYVLEQAGLRVPATLISNDPDEVRAFYHAHQGRVIFKPVRGGAHTARVSEADLVPERLQELSKSPVQFQELVEGVDIRVYLVGEELFAAEIHSQTLDFRADPQADLRSVSLPDAVAADCRTLARVLQLQFSGIDIRRTPAGEYVFLEGNPSPMFMHFERVTGYPISDRLADLLMC